MAVRCPDSAGVEGVCVYPIVLDLRSKRILVVGGGPVAARKVRRLLEAGAFVVVVAPRICAALEQQAADPRLEIRRRPFEIADLDGVTLTFAASDDEAVNDTVCASARERGTWVNDAASGVRGDFNLPAIHRAGTITIAVDTGAQSPSFAQRIRDEIATQIDDRYGRAAATVATMRAYALAVVEPALRSPALRELAGREIVELAAMNPVQAHDAVDAVVTSLQRPGLERDATHRQLVCATRSSGLAMWQARHVMAKLAVGGVASTVLTITTTGDRVVDRSLTSIGTGIFVKELEHALRERRADYAVHSCKDLPSALPADMRLAAIGERADPRDAFCSEVYRSFEDLPAGAVVGSSSPRRTAQMQAVRDDLRYASIRGNVDTRLRKLSDGRYDAIVLAMAGLERLDLRARYTTPLDPAVYVPAAGQGALAIECRDDDPQLAALLAQHFSDRETELAVHAERAFLFALRAGCQAPVGAFATWHRSALSLVGKILSADGRVAIEGRRDGQVTSVEAAEEIGAALARELGERGGYVLLSQVLQSLPLRGTLCLLPRTQGRTSRIAPALTDIGADVVEATDSAQAAAALGDRTPDVLLFPSSGSVAAIAEYLERLRAVAARPLVAVMGPASSQAVRACGFVPDVVAPQASVASFVHAVTEFLLRGKQ